MTEFVGKFLNKIDKKGRVSVPALWRPKLLGEGFSGIVAQLTNGYNSVDGYSKNYLERYQDWLDKARPTTWKEMNMKQLLFLVHPCYLLIEKVEYFYQN